MATLGELKREILRQKRKKEEFERKRRIFLESQREMQKLGKERKELERELERELDLLKNPKKAEAIRGLKRQGRFVGGVFKKIYEAVPDPHAPVKKKTKKVVRRRKKVKKVVRRRKQR